MPGFDMKHFTAPPVLLERHGIFPREITDVIITHAHHDHIQAVKYFPEAVIHIQKDELKKGRTYIPENFTVAPFEDEADICPQVKAVKIGGHSSGSSIVEIRAAGREYVIAGDECYLRACLTNKIPTGSSACPEKSEAFIEKYADPRYTVLLCHDPDILPGENGLLQIL